MWLADSQQKLEQAGACSESLVKQHDKSVINNSYNDSISQSTC